MCQREPLPAAEEIKVFLDEKFPPDAANNLSLDLIVSTPREGGMGLNALLPQTGPGTLLGDPSYRRSGSISRMQSSKLISSFRVGRAARPVLVGGRFLDNATSRRLNAPM